MMTQAQEYKVAVFETDPHEMAPAPKVVWERHYGRKGYYYDGTPQSKAKYLGFADGSRLRINRGGTVTALPIS